MDTFRQQSQGKRGKIWCGGLITPIALHLGVRLRGLRVLEESKDVDRAQLMQNQMITSLGPQEFLRLSNDALFPLPHPALTHVTDITYRDNWSMHTREHLALCRSVGGRPTGVRLTARGDPRGTVYPREQRETEEERQPEMMEHDQGMEQQQASFFEGGTSGTQQEEAQAGSSAQYTGDMSPEQWSIFQAFMGRHDAFMERQDSHNLKVDAQFESQQGQLDTLSRRVRLLGVNVGELAHIGTQVLHSTRGSTCIRNGQGTLRRSFMTTFVVIPICAIPRRHHHHPCQPSHRTSQNGIESSRNLRGKKKKRSDKLVDVHEESKTRSRILR